VLLFLIIFLWTPPHFWALSLLRSGEYARAGIPMLPVVAGCAETRRQILLYTGVLVPVSLSPWLLGHAGLLYGVVAVAAGACLSLLAYRVWAAAEGRASDRAARRLFGFSIVYLFALFAGLLADRALIG
jgi:protoheme IX farnesyltransferase